MWRTCQKISLWNCFLVETCAKSKCFQQMAEAPTDCNPRCGCGRSRDGWGDQGWGIADSWRRSWDTGALWVGALWVGALWVGTSGLSLSFRSTPAATLLLHLDCAFFQTQSRDFQDSFQLRDGNEDTWLPERQGNVWVSNLAWFSQLSGLWSLEMMDQWCLRMQDQHSIRFLTALGGVGTLGWVLFQTVLLRRTTMASPILTGNWYPFGADGPCLRPFW